MFEAHIERRKAISKAISEKVKILILLVYSENENFYYWMVLKLDDQWKSHMQKRQAFFFEQAYKNKQSWAIYWFTY